ncbi:MAG: immune inhibitor A [Syntrophobacteraceae bacterium]|nr:immune inhibitor A [Syntrophobacteraceae bacterium]
MVSKKSRRTAVMACVVFLFFMGMGWLEASPPRDKDAVPASEDKELPGKALGGSTKDLPASRKHKEIDQPNPKDYRRMQLRRQLQESLDRAMKSGEHRPDLKTQVDKLAKRGVDKVLVILVEFAGTDTFTWSQGASTWDPLGKADPNESTGVVGDCSKIITSTQVFTYTGPLHNQIQRPLSESDRSGDMIWVEDFDSSYYQSIIDGNGIVFNYTRADSSTVHEDFTGKSVRTYLEDQSGGLYSIDADVYGWFQVPHSVWWYGADPCPGAQSGLDVAHHGAIPGAGNAKSLVRDALDLLKAQHPEPEFWAQYDQDGDGYIDRLWIIHAGLGEEDSSVLLNRTSYGESGLWSHSSNIGSYEIVPGIYAGPYIMMPENSGIDVLAHEYGHNLGTKDLYAYGHGETSAGFWTIMADDWTGYPIGFLPPSLDPYHLDGLGWLNPFTITDPKKTYTLTVGQISNFPGGDDVYRGIKIPLTNGSLPLPVRPVGHYQWWSGQGDLVSATMTLNDTVSLPAGGGTLSFDLAYDIEFQWDFLWVQVSSDGGTHWTILTNGNTTCTHESGWIGGSYGFPEDLCGAGIGGFTGNNESYPSYGAQTFDLSRFSGRDILLRFWYMTDWSTPGKGAFIDNVRIVSATGTTLFQDNGEGGGGNWSYAEGFEWNNGSQSFTHNLYFQYRNVSDTGGFDSCLGESRWRFGPANTGLLAWYNNNYYTDNEVFNHLFDNFGFGPKGLMMVVDANPEPYRDPYYIEMGYDNEGGNISHRSLMRDAPFSLWDSVDFTMKPPSVHEETSFAGRPAVSLFDDSSGYYPGAEFVSRGPGYDPSEATKWVTGQWDASVVMPSHTFYGIKAPGYTANEEFRWNCSKVVATGRLSCYWLGADTGLGYDGSNGNPGDVSGQYGWKAQILSQTDTTATVKIWNSVVPVADFKADVTKGKAPLEVRFRDKSRGEITDHLWDFGDGTTSTESDPVHTYTKGGKYTVKLTVTGPHGTDTKKKTKYIEVYVPPVANFTAAVTSGKAPFRARFEDRSKGTVTQRLWKFGDGATSTKENPTHVYKKPGRYTVQLKATGPGGSNVKTRKNYINVVR